jgi:hypothetical protein
LENPHFWRETIILAANKAKQNSRRKGELYINFNSLKGSIFEQNAAKMKLTTPEISWHGKQPVLSVDFCKVGCTMRFASAGADNDVKVSHF